MNSSQRPIRGDADESEELPVLILPPMGEVPSQNLSLGSGTITGTPLLPELVGPDTDAPDNLANRVEQMLAEDGRFSPLLPHLLISADESNGRVTLGYPAPEPSLMPALLHAVRSVPGVKDVVGEAQ